MLNQCLSLSRNQLNELRIDTEETGKVSFLKIGDEDMSREITKLVFKDADNTKVVFGYVLQETDDFITIESTRGATFTINKNCIVFTKIGDHNDY